MRSGFRSHREVEAGTRFAKTGTLMAFKNLRTLRGDRGAQVVEFALIVPIVLLLIGAVIQFGFMFNAQVTVTQAAREGARFASLNPVTGACDAACVAAKVRTKVEGAAPGLSFSNPTTQIKVTACLASYDENKDAVVVVEYTVNLGAPLLNQTVHVRGKAHMPCGG
jgi:Flp pilus assembly protein TadG